VSNDDIVRAVFNGDDELLEKTGWLAFFERLRALYPRKKWPATEQATYVEILQSPITAFAALNSWMLGEKSQWPPAAVELSALMRRAQSEPPAEQQGRQHQHRTDNTPHAYATVRALLASGHRVCDCRPRPANMEISESTGVITCLACGGLEQGQVDQAEEATTF
jgi:hypothetical protein